MKIIIEGADGVGKTALAKHINDNLANTTYVHHGPPTSKEYAMDESFAMAAPSNSGVIEILDRSWLGEFVYPQLFRGYTSNYFEMLESYIKKNKERVLYIMLYAQQPFGGTNNNAEFLGKHSIVQREFINLFNSIKSGEKIIFNVDNFSSIDVEHVRILEFIKHWILHEIPYQTTDDLSYTMFNDAFRFVGTPPFPVLDTHCSCGHYSDHKMYDYYKKTGNIVWGAGNIDCPKYIFISEAPGWQGAGRTGIPYYNDKSGNIFRTALFYNRLLESEVYICNASTCTPANNKISMNYARQCAELHLFRQLGALKNKLSAKMIAVGRVADTILHEHGIPHQFVYHPAYYFRASGDMSRATNMFMENLAVVL